MGQINVKKENLLTLSIAQKLFKYNPTTGILYWRSNRSPTVRCGDIAGTDHCKGYRSVQVNHNNYLVHRLIWLIIKGVWPKNQIDHIDHDRGNNKIDNLREATQTENQRNGCIQKNNTSGFVGVYWSKANKKWRAGICLNNKNMCLGYFIEKADAIAAREAANIKYNFLENHGQ